MFPNAWTLKELPWAFDVQQFSVCCTENIGLYFKSSGALSQALLLFYQA